MDGVQFLQEAQRVAPDSVRIMLTGNADQQTAAGAVNEGRIFRFLNKPCTPEDLGHALTAGLEQYRLITAEKELLEKTLGGTIKMLMEILATVDPDLFGRAQALRLNMRALADALGAAGLVAPSGLLAAGACRPAGPRRHGDRPAPHRRQGAAGAGAYPRRSLRSGSACRRRATPCCGTSRAWSRSPRSSASSTSTSTATASPTARSAAH